MRITESQLRKIIRQEVRRLSEVAPGVMAPRQPDMTAEDLHEQLSELNNAVTERLYDLGFEDRVNDPKARLMAFDGHGLDLAAGYDEDTGEEYEQVHDQVSVVELMGADFRLIGKTVAGLEEITGGSIVNTIIGFGYDPDAGFEGVTVDLETDRGTTVEGVTMAKIANCCAY